ncbi:hypothetical protein TCSYLVIO_005058 [Trypanosoma cruzi]|nr:hypothetical protein TCSYLVIO_005058 [Trypanosoma cruzi]
MFFVFPSVIYPRRTEERIFKGLYHICNAAHFISLVVLLTEFYVRQTSVFPGYFGGGEVSLSPGLKAASENCNYSKDIRIGEIRTVIHVNSENLPLPLRVMAECIIAVLVVQFLAVLNNVLSLLNYSAGRRHLRICGVHVPFYHILSTFSIIYCVVLVAVVWITYPMRNFYREAILACAAEVFAKNSTKLAESEFDGYDTFSTPIEWAFSAAVINLFICFLGVGVLIWNSYKPEIRLFSEATVPWEGRGLSCRPNKAALRIHTKARDRILSEAREALEQGQKVRIMCSYALMTEAEYEAQVQEMQQLFATQLKEQQFEHLHTHFDRESELEGNGLLWRRQTSPPPPPPEDADEFFNMEDISPVNGNGVKIGGGDEFCEILDEPDIEERFWSECEGSGYEAENADDGGELARGPLQGGTQDHRLRKKRRRHRHQLGVESEIATQRERASIAQPDLGEALYDGEATGQEGLQGDSEESLQGHRHHHARRRRRRRHHSHAVAKRDGESEGQIADAEVRFEDADEL